MLDESMRQDLLVVKMPKTKRELLTLIFCVVLGAMIGVAFVAAFYKVMVELGVFVDYN